MTSDFFNSLMSTWVQFVSSLGFAKESALLVMIVAISVGLALGGIVFYVFKKNKPTKETLASKPDDGDYALKSPQSFAPTLEEVKKTSIEDKPQSSKESKTLEKVSTEEKPQVPLETNAQKDEPSSSELTSAKEAKLPDLTPIEIARVSSEEEALIEALSKTKSGFMAKLSVFFKRGQQKLSEEDLEEVEAILYGADLGVKTVEKLLTALKEKLVDQKQWQDVLKDEMKHILKNYNESKPETTVEKPRVILFVGVNGAGKTTSIGKLGKHFLDQGKKVIFGAGDTFRAAAVTQLQIWADRVNAAFVSAKEKSDSASVLFETIQRGKNEGFDVVLCDTAGRLHTKTELMDELKKVYRVVEKALGRKPDEVLLVIDATMGQNALVQAREFSGCAPISGVVLSKVDGTAKGGIALAIVEELKIPIRYIGVGEKETDLKEFDANQFVEALFL